MSFAISDSLRLQLVVPPEVRAGTTVPIVLRVENRTAKPIDLYLRGRTITFDVVVAGADGAVVWRRLEGEIIPAVVQLRVLAQGEVLELRTQWKQRTGDGAQVPAGRYTLHGLLLTDAPAPLESAPADMVIKGGG